MPSWNARGLPCWSIRPPVYYGGAGSEQRPLMDCGTSWRPTLEAFPGDVPILYLDRNPIDEITFDAVMHKLFHLSSFDNLDVAVSLRNLPEVSTQSVRMLTWGLKQMNGFAKTSRVEVHLSPMDKPQKILLNAARGPLMKLFDGDKPLVQVPFQQFVFLLQNQQRIRCRSPI